MAQSRRISLQDRGISLSCSGLVPLFLRGGLIADVFGMGGDGQERGGEHGQGDVAIPGVVAANLVVIEPGLVLGELERFLDRPARPGHPVGFQKSGSTFDLR